MSGRIPQSFIDELVSRTDVVELIGQRVPLKRAGKDYKACCPFHEEKTPSFTVVPDKQFYHCFGCGAHGTALGFLMEYERMEFLDAVEELARRAGLEVPREGGRSEPSAPLAPVYETLERANEFYRAQLREHPGSERAKDYLKGRGLSGEVAAEFQLGFAPPGWDALSGALGNDAGQRERLVTAGLAVDKGAGKVYDRFRDRIMFPILDTRGRVVGFGARIIDQGEPKYLNSPETPVFHKGRELYGLWQARRSNRRLERLIVVEGYMDVVALAQHGIRNAVATLGTAATEDHVQRLFRSASDVIFCFDGDAAGRRAAWRALENTLPAIRAGRQAFFMFLPEGEDPDSLVRSAGSEAFEALADRATPLSAYLFDHLMEGIDLDTPEGRAKLVATIRPHLERIPDGPYRRQLALRLADLSGDRQSSTLSGVSQARRPTRAPVARRRTGGADPPVRRAIRLLLHEPRVGRAPVDIAFVADSGLPGAEFLAEMIETVRSHPELTTGSLLERYRDHQWSEHLGALARDVPVLASGLEAEFESCLELIRGLAERRRRTERREALTRKRPTELTEAERRELAELLAAGTRAVE